MSKTKGPEPPDTDPPPQKKIAPKNLLPLPDLDPDPEADPAQTHAVFHKPEGRSGGHVLCTFNHYRHEMAFGVRGVVALWGGGGVRGGL